MKESLTIDAAPVLSHFRAMSSLGVPHDTLEEMLGMKMDGLEIKDARIPFINNIKMIEKGIELIGPELPLKLGKFVSLDEMGACGYIFKNCNDLEDVANQFLRYQRLLYAVANYKISFTNHTIIIEHSIKMPIYRCYNRMLVELAFSAMTTIIQSLIGEEIVIRELSFTHPKPEYAGFYQEIFRVPVKFNQTHDMLVLDKKQLKKLIPNSHTYIKDTLIQHADGLLTQIDTDIQLKDEVKRLIVAHLNKGDVDIEMISGKLNMSRWTLTRKLKIEGITFKQLMNKVRMEAAMNFLKSPKLSLTDIAFLLGYSEVNAFSRAFKSWTGVNPSEYPDRQSK